MYHGTRDWLKHISTQRNITIEGLDAGEDDALEQSLHAGTTELVWIGTAVNPTWVVIEIRRAGAAAHAAGDLQAIEPRRRLRVPFSNELFERPQRCNCWRGLHGSVRRAMDGDADASHATRVRTSTD